MELDKKRLAEQRKIVQKWVDNKGIGTIVGPTGFGKSMVGIITVQSMNARHPDRNTIIIVPTDELKKQWNNHIKTYGLLKTSVVIVNTAIKKKLSCHLLILDEIHRYAATTFQKVFSTIEYKFIQGLTATFEREDNKHYLIENKCPVIYQMDVKEAKSKKYISDFNIFNLNVPLTSEDKQFYDDITNKFNYFFSWFEHDFHRAKLCLNDKNYTSHYAAKRKTSFDDVRIKAINFFRVMGKRKQFLFGNDSKLAVVKQILDTYPVKAIVFSETTSFADKITKVMGEKCVSLHTNISPKKREEILQDYASIDSKIKILSTAKMFDEGIDLPDIELAIVASGTSSKRQGIQRFGRAIRKKQGKTALIVNLYMEGTQEQKWVEKRTSGLSPEWIESVEDIEKGGVLNYDALKYNISLFQ